MRSHACKVPWSISWLSYAEPTVIFTDFKDEISGLLSREWGKLIIGVASKQSVVRQRFTIAHELVMHCCIKYLQSTSIDTLLSCAGPLRRRQRKTYKRLKQIHLLPNC